MSLTSLSVSMSALNRQQSFRRAVIFHLIVVTAACAAAMNTSPRFLPFLGDAALIAGIVEGAGLVGWRLVQLPKSQALEFLLVSPLRPGRFLAAEAAAGLGRFALVTLSGLPLWLALVSCGQLVASDLIPLMVM